MTRWYLPNGEQVEETVLDGFPVPVPVSGAKPTAVIIDEVSEVPDYMWDQLLDAAKREGPVVKVWLLWDDRDYYTRELMGVYATEAAARAAWREAVRADAERKIDRIEEQGDRFRIPPSHMLGRTLGRQPTKAERVDKVHRELERTLSRGIDGFLYSLEDRDVEG